MSELSGGRLDKARSIKDDQSEGTFFDQQIRESLTSSEIQYLAQNPDLTERLIEEIKTAVKKHQNPRAKQMREGTKALDAIQPKAIYDAVLALRTAGIDPTHNQVQKTLGAGRGLFGRLHYAPGISATVHAQQKAYELAIRGVPWTEEVSAHTEEAKEEVRANPEKQRTMNEREQALHDLASRNERVRSRLTELSEKKTFAGKATALIYQVAETSDHIENLQETTTAWNSDALAQLARIKGTIEQVENAVREMEAQNEQ